MSTPVLAFAGGGGGQLVSSLAVNVAGLMAKAGNRLLIAGTSPTLGTDLGVPDLHLGEVHRGVRTGLDAVVVEDAHHLVDVVAQARAGYDAVVVDGATPAADHLVVPVRPDRASLQGLRRFLGDPSPVAPHLIGVVLAGVPVRPRSIGVRSRRAAAEMAGGASVFVASVRSDVAVAWSARERGLLVHELAASMDRTVLDGATVEAVIGLSRDYAQVAEEVVVRLHDRA